MVRIAPVNKHQDIKLHIHIQYTDTQNIRHIYIYINKIDNIAPGKLCAMRNVNIVRAHFFLCLLTTFAQPLHKLIYVNEKIENRIKKRSENHRTSLTHNHNSSCNRVSDQNNTRHSVLCVISFDNKNQTR